MPINLWAGPELKLEYALYHYTKMGEALRPPTTPRAAALEAQGVIVDTGWQRALYAHLDAFLSITRSIPEIIQCCFGVDAMTGRRGHPMQIWFAALSLDEQRRRQDFHDQFKPHYDGFRALPLGPVRHIIEHRTGVAPATVTIVGMYGVTHVGGPGNPVPLSETRQIDDPNLQHLAKPHPIRPRWDDFEIDGQPLFRACQNYLDEANKLVAEARLIAGTVHGTSVVSDPPT